jgi:hypothetical protein
MDNESIGYLSYYGSSILDCYLMKQMEQNENCYYIVPNLPSHVVKDRISWHYSNETNKFLNEELMIEKILGKLNSTYTYLICNISVDRFHRNLLIIDNINKQFHCFEPNNVDRKNEKKCNDDMRTTLENYLKPVGYTITDPVYNYHTSFLDIEHFIENDIQKKIIRTGICAGCCYYFLDQVLKNKSLQPDGFEMIEFLMNLHKNIINEHELEIIHNTFLDNEKQDIFLKYVAEKDNELCVN